MAADPSFRLVLTESKGTGRGGLSICVSRPRPARATVRFRGIRDHLGDRGSNGYRGGRSIRDLPRLNKLHGEARWRKLKGRASVRLPSGRVRVAELHWYEAHGIGKRDFKIKRYLD